MNIFVLDTDQEKAAHYHVDKHVVKMPLETAQLLCTVHHLSGTKSDMIPYRATHKNHPSTKWAAESLSNYKWLVELGIRICEEYTYRYEKVHKCEEVVRWCEKNIPDIPDSGLTSFAQAMPDECKRADAVEAYREYYKKSKSHLFSWRKRGKPSWL